MDDLISIIIPVFNVERYIDETITSVINQSYNNLEVILVNDGSTDNSKAICEKYVNNDNRITLINQINAGVSVARNKGLEASKGKYIFFMDSDDTIDEEFIKSSYNAAINDDAEITVIGEYYYNRMKKIIALPTCAQFIKKSFLNNSRILFPKNIQPCEDGLFSHQLLCLTNKIGYNESGIYHYRSHENQNHIQINKKTHQLLKQIPLWFDILENFYNSNQLFLSHSLNLALFIEHEPFELRYLSIDFDTAQKKELHSIIVQFMSKNVFPHLNNADKSNLSKKFLLFSESRSISHYEMALNRSRIKLKFLRKIILFVINFIPSSSNRKLFRVKLNSYIEREQY
jgi:glycosyltransferase involved in cell wall biosynthesis